MPRLSVAQFQERQDGILDAAAEVFARKGYENTSIAELARAAEISDGLVYRYFDGKRDVLFQVLARFYRRNLEKLDTAIAREIGFAARLRALVFTHLEVQLNEPGLCRLFISEVRHAGDYPGSDIQELNRQYTEVFLRLLAEGRGDGEVRQDFDARTVRDVFFGGLEHLAWRAIHGSGTFDIAKAADDISALVIHGLAKAP